MIVAYPRLSCNPPPAQRGLYQIRLSPETSSRPVKTAQMLGARGGSSEAWRIPRRRKNDERNDADEQFSAAEKKEGGPCGPPSIRRSRSCESLCLSSSRPG